MIGEVLPRRGRLGPLLRYLFTEGQAGEKGLHSAHVDPRLVGCWDGRPQALVPSVAADGRQGFSAITARLLEPVAALGWTAREVAERKLVYHLAISSAKVARPGQVDGLDRTDPLLSDAQWADIAAEYLHHLLLARRDDDRGVRWIAVRHAQEHIHVVATLARQDGRRPKLFHDFRRSREASAAVERSYGLQPSHASSRDGAVPWASPREVQLFRETVRRRQAAGLPPPTARPRDVLRRQVRTAVAAAADQESFFAWLHADGLLVRQRFDLVDPTRLHGYAVALPDRDDTGWRPLWLPAGKVAPDLAWPRVRYRWQELAGAAPTASAAGAGRWAGEPERPALWARADATVAAAHAGLVQVGGAPAAVITDTLWATTDFLAALGRVLEGPRGGPLGTAALAYDHAARDPVGVAPPPHPAGTALRTAGRALLRLQVARPSERAAVRGLLGAAVLLTEAAGLCRERQGRLSQAHAARTASAGIGAVLARWDAAPGERAGAGQGVAQLGAAVGQDRPPVTAPSAPVARRR